MVINIMATILTNMVEFFFLTVVITMVAVKLNARFDDHRNVTTKMQEQLNTIQKDINAIRYGDRQ